MTYKMEMLGLEGLLTALVLIAIPFIILAVLVRILPTQRLGDQLSGAE
jgi:hypothetical protein